MKRLILILAVAFTLVAATVAYAYLKPTEEASGPIEAIPIQLEATATSAPVTSAEPTAEAEIAANPSPTAEASTADVATETEEVAEPTEVPIEEATATTEVAPTTEATTSETSSPIIFEIDQASSQATYTIDEVLRGNPTTVVGTTNQIAGQIAVDPTNPAATQLGTIQVNARTFATDEGQRDRAVQNRILFTNDYEFITFTPTSVVGLPESVSAGEAYSFQVIGNLTIRDQTREVTWDVTVTPVSETQLEGSATITIQYADWGVAIPNVPFVASVSDQVRLDLNFVAMAAS